MAPSVVLMDSVHSTSYSQPHHTLPHLRHSFCRVVTGGRHHSGGVGGRRQRLQGCRHGSAVKVTAGIKVIESYDGKFELAKESEAALKQLLGSPTFAKQVVQETGQLDGTELTFTGMLFQPVPWSLNTKKGMPADYENYAADSDYVIINTPPNFMFQAKIFKPSRLCAIYKKK